MFLSWLDDTKNSTSRAWPKYYMSYFGSFGPGSDVVMYGSSKPTTDQEIFRDTWLVLKFVILCAGESVSVGVFDNGCASMTGKNGRLLARGCQIVQISTH